MAKDADNNNKTTPHDTLKTIEMKCINCFGYQLDEMKTLAEIRDLCDTAIAAHG